MIGGSKLSFFFFIQFILFFSHQKNSLVWNMDSQHDSDLSVVDTLKMKMMRWISDSRKDYIKNEHICGTRSYVNLAKLRFLYILF